MASKATIHASQTHPIPSMASKATIHASQTHPIPSMASKPTIHASQTHPIPSMASKPTTTEQGTTLTTFVQADPYTFRALVQKLTGADDSSPQPKLPITLPARQLSRPTSTDMGPRRPAFKLQERRQNMRKLEINLSPTSRHARNPSKGEMLLVSPVSTLDRLFLRSPRTPTSPSFPCWEDEERAIAHKGFYLHPTVALASRNAEPELLPLFPMHSPKQNSPPSS